MPHRLRAALTCSVLLGLAAGGLSGCTGTPTVPPGSGTGAATPSSPATTATAPSPTSAPTSATTSPTEPQVRPTPTPSTVPARYPWHTDIVSTTFWVGEVFDPNAADGSQVYSTYDSRWMAHYGGCDGRIVKGVCRTERRTAANGWFPTAMTPRENPFYLDLPFDDVNDPKGFAMRGRVIPWAAGARSAGLLRDQSTSLMKNRWVELRKGGRVCFGQIEDAGPGQYHDARYVFGHDDARPVNHRYGGAGLDVSPAINGCLGYAELDGDTDRVSWRFVDAHDVPAGPWTRIVTTSGVR